MTPIRPYRPKAPIMPNNMQTVGFIGVGGIGRPMAERLAKANFDLIVCDKRDSALEPFRALGTRITVSPSDCAAADMVIVMVANDAQSLSVIEGEDGLLHDIDPDRPPLVAVMSTILPQTIASIASQLAQKGAHMVDAPVSGGVVRAERGELSIIVGGEPDDLAAMKHVFEALGTRIFHCGALGSGVAIKILNNLMGITTQTLMTELGQIAERLGIDMKLLVTVMEAGSGRNFATLDYEAQRAMYRHTASDLALLKSHVDICRKDLGLAQALAGQSGVSAPLLEGIATVHREIPYEQTFASWKFLSSEQVKDSAHG